MTINTIKHLAYILRLKPEELLQIVNNVNQYYYEKKEPKLDKENNPKFKNGIQQFRILTPSKEPLKSIQEKIHKRILLKIKLPDYAFGGVKGRDNVQNALRHKGKKFNFTTDLSNYFPSISSSQVFKMYRSNGFSPSVSQILTKLTTYEGKLPQGTPTSPTISNLVFVPTGLRLNSLAEKNKITFTSFIDDLTFSSPIDFKDLTFQFIDIITENFILSHKKTFYKTYRPTITGIVVTNNYLYLPENFKKKLTNLEGKTVEQINGLKNYESKVLNTNIKNKPK